MFVRVCNLHGRHHLVEIVRDVEGRFWFQGKQVAEVLNYVNTRQAVRRHVCPRNRRTFGELQDRVDDREFANSQTIYVDEDGVRDLLTRSRRPEGDLFRDWMAHVLDDLRGEKWQPPVSRAGSVYIATRTEFERRKLYKLDSSPEVSEDVIQEALNEHDPDAGFFDVGFFVCRRWTTEDAPSAIAKVRSLVRPYHYNRSFYCLEDVGATIAQIDELLRCEHHAFCQHCVRV